MTTTGGVAKGILIFSCAYFLFVMLLQAATGQTAMAVFMIVGFLIPLSFILYGSATDRKTRNLPPDNSD
jgi:hypothetical protein